jgi:uncharacterized membrane protein YkvI
MASPLVYAFTYENSFYTSFEDTLMKMFQSAEESGRRIHREAQMSETDILLIQMLLCYIASNMGNNAIPRFTFTILAYIISLMLLWEILV